MSTLNIGGQLIENTDYSTGEVKTGARWIDGKPIYRKVYQGTSTTYSDGNSSREFTLPITTGVSSLVNVYGTIKPNNGNLAGITFGYPQTLSTSAMNLIVLSPNIRFLNGNVGINVLTYVSHACTSLDYTITVEYTKTT